jgi:hypothetical protein
VSFSSVLGSRGQVEQLHFTPFKQMLRWFSSSVKLLLHAFHRASRIIFIKINPHALNTIKLRISTLPNKNSVASISHHFIFLVSILFSSHQKEEDLEPPIKVMHLLSTEIMSLILPRQLLYLI